MSENGKNNVRDAVQVVIWIGSSITISVMISVWLVANHADTTHEKSITTYEWAQVQRYREETIAEMKTDIRALWIRVEALRLSIAVLERKTELRDSGRTTESDLLPSE